MSRSLLPMSGSGLMPVMAKDHRRWFDSSNR